jgi:hypothetical protein
MLAAVAVATTAAKWIAADKKSVRQQLERSIGCSSVMRYTREWGGMGCKGVYGVERKEDNLDELDGVCAPLFSDRWWRRSASRHKEHKKRRGRGKNEMPPPPKCVTFFPPLYD